MTMGIDKLTEKLEAKAKKTIVQYVDKDFDENHTWTIYFLLDIRVVYIISYVYISVINLISSTASIEATDDKHTDVIFRVTSNTTGHVTEISDAVLWNCREHSASSYYYRFLYWMLLVALISALAGFAISKVITLINIGIVSPENALTRLWHIAVFKYLECNHKEDTAKWSQEYLSISMKNLPIDVFEKVKSRRANFWRAIFTFLVLFMLIAGMALSYLSYDLHPLVCIRREKDAYIQYHQGANNTGRVEINLYGHLRHFQIASGATVVLLALIISSSALGFYCASKKIVEYMKENHVKDYIARQITKETTS